MVSGQGPGTWPAGELDSTEGDRVLNTLQVHIIYDVLNTIYTVQSVII